MKKSILVTGGAGFPGSHLCGRLLNILHLFGSPHFWLYRRNATFPFYVEVDQIYNFACPVSPIYSQFDSVQTTRTSVPSLLN